MSERDYKKEYRDYHSKPENMADRVKRNLWNRRLKGKVPEGKEIDHKNSLASGGSNDKSNIRYRNISENRADKTMIKSAFLYGIGGEGVSAYAKNNIPHALGNSLSDRIANKVLGKQVYVNGVNVELQNKKKNVVQQKTAAYGATLGALGADEGAANKAKGAVAGTLAGWAATPPALMMSAKMLKSSNGRIGGKAIQDMSVRELAKTLVKNPKQSIEAIGKRRFLLATVGVPYVVGGVGSYSAGKYYGRNNKLKEENDIKKQASIEYRGEHFDGYNKPKQAPAGDDHKMVVLAKKGDDVKLIRFGKRGYDHNYSKDAKQNYLTRSAGIRDKNGNLTKDDKLSANYWARKTLWPKNQKADGTSTLSKDRNMNKNAHYEISYTDRHAIHKYRGLSKIAMGSINRRSWEHLLDQAQEGDIFSHNTNLAHYAKEEGAKKGLSGLAISGGIKALTGSPEHHTAMVGIDPDSGKKVIYHLHETSGGNLAKVDPEKYINDFGKHTDLTLIRPNMSEADKKKAMDFVRKHQGDEYAYHDLPAHAAKQVANKVGMGGVVDKAHSAIMGGVKNCDSATGVCSTLPAKAYSQVDSNFVENHLGKKSGDSRLIAPRDYTDAVKKGLMTEVGKYEFSDRELSKPKAVVGAVTKDAKDTIKGVGRRVLNAVSKIRK